MSYADVATGSNGGSVSWADGAVDRLADILGDNPPTKEQFWELNGSKRRQKSNEWYLWKSVLEVALKDYQDAIKRLMFWQSTNPDDHRFARACRMLAEVRAWFESDSGRIGSFVFVCDVMSRDDNSADWRPEEIRKKVFALPKSSHISRQYSARHTA